jgi:hypothetical protein
MPRFGLSLHPCGKVTHELSLPKLMSARIFVPLSCDRDLATVLPTILGCSCLVYPTKNSKDEPV